MKQEKSQLTFLFEAALAGVSAQKLLSKALRRNKIAGSCCLIAIGKAAVAMAKAADHQLPGQIDAGLIITKQGYAKDAPFPVIESGHPYPTEESLAAGAALLQFIKTRPRDSHFLILLSGGASSLVEVLPADISFDYWRGVNEYLLSHNVPITTVNQVRGRLSLIKNGGLLNAIGSRLVTEYLLSDVADDDPTIIASGLLHPQDPDRWQTVVATLPSWVTEQCRTVVIDGKVTSRVKSHILANNSDALKQVYHVCQMQGLAATVMAKLLLEPVEQAAEAIAQHLLTMQPGIVVWGGECTMNLPENPGQGGRCQHLALLVAEKIAGRDDVCLLAAGTDGSDGPGQVAGALIDGQTVSRGETAGVDLTSCLASANAGIFLAASGDLLQTGPTGTHVMDIIIGCRRNE